MELKNGLLGIAIPVSQSFHSSSKVPAPVQYFIYADGVYSDNTPNYLETESQAISLKTTIVRQSKEEITAKLEYQFQRKKYGGPAFNAKGSEAGVGYYTCMITVKRGEKVIIFEEEANYEVSYRVKISKGLEPDKARYRGWNSSTPENGYEPDGKVYRPENTRGYPMDATVDINYSKPKVYPKLALWDVAGGEINTGRYWQVYNSKAGKDANLFGFFQGKPGRLIGGRHIGVNLQVSPEDLLNQQKNIAEINISIARRGPDNSWFPLKRYQWGAFISTMSDLAAPDKTQGIAREMNRFSGLGNAIRSYAEKPVKLSPAFNNGAIYMPAQKVGELIRAVKSNNTLYRDLCQSDPEFKRIWDSWKYPDSAISVKKMLLAQAEKMRKEYVDGEGTYNFEYRYWMGARLFKHYAMLTTGLFADKSIMISATEKRNLESFVGLMARILWDENNAPVFDDAGINLGTANMPFMYNNNGKYFFALLLANDPEFAGRAKEVGNMVARDLNNAIYDNGSGFGSPHYIQAAIDPLLFSMLQLKQAGVMDLYKKNRKVIAFAKFYLSLLTPPSPRFNGNRKLISFGDGSEESAATFALLAAGLEDLDRKLSSELLSAYRYGPPRTSIFGPVALAVQHTNSSDKRISAGDACYTGYLSHFRSGINTNNETAVWVLNGEAMYDHRRDDAGEIAIYALQAPLSLSSSSFYSPAATDARIKSVVVPSKLFPEWSSAEQPIAGRSLTNRTWPVSATTAFASLGSSTTTTIKMNTSDGADWYRRITMINIREDAPYIILYDSITGSRENIWSIPMMSEGPVGTPAGNINPVKRIHDNAKLKELPQGTNARRINPGLNRFSFTGQEWKQHNTGGINWDLFTISSSAMEFSLASWATTWQNTLEIQDFQRANQRKYEEEQQILRLKSEKPFFNIILPRNKKQGRSDNDPKLRPDNSVLFRENNAEVSIGTNWYQLNSNRESRMALFNNGYVQRNGISLSGGEVEIAYSSNLLTVRVHGGSGTRKLELPFIVKASGKYPEVSLQSERGKTRLSIGFASTGTDMESGMKGYKEYKFNISN